jgi:hypothetical protein
MAWHFFSSALTRSLFANELHRLSFVDYLRLSFRWAGLPGLNPCRSQGRAPDLVGVLDPLEGARFDVGVLKEAAISDLPLSVLLCWRLGPVLRWHPGS